MHHDYVLFILILRCPVSLITTFFSEKLINTVLQTSGNAVPLRNALATKAGDRASLEPRRASTPGIHPATALRGEYSDANGNPSVRPQQTAGVPSSMPHLLSVPAKHSHPEPQVQIQPQQRLLHNHPEFKAPNEVAASRPLESPVQSPMTHSVLSQNPSTEDQVQQLLQLLVSTALLTVQKSLPIDPCILFD